MGDFAITTRMELIQGNLTGRIVSAAMQVHRALGPGLLESVYRCCLARQLEMDGIAVEHEVPIPVVYQDLAIDSAFRADMIVERSVLLELKAVEKLAPIHQAQTLTYMNLSGLHVGFLINFNVTSLKHGLHRFVR